MYIMYTANGSSMANRTDFELATLRKYVTEEAYETWRHKTPLASAC